MNHVTCRLATKLDLPALADLRWRLKTEDGDIVDQESHAKFVAQFAGEQKNQWPPDDVFHWVAEDLNRIVAAMSVVIVKKVPAPDALTARWGYLTNCYALPDVRNAGVGARLLTVVRQWAIDEQPEMLVVWPSERAFSFYQRAGFRRPRDPLVLDLSG